MCLYFAKINCNDISNLLSSINEDIENEFLINDVLNRDKKLNASFCNLIKLPKDGTEKRKLERSREIRSIFLITKNQKITSDICNLAEKMRIKQKNTKRHKREK